MLITLCYSVLTWIQSRHRKEITSWVDEVIVKEKATILCIRDAVFFSSDDGKYDKSEGFSESERSDSFYSFGDLPNDNLSHNSSVNNSNFSTPKKEPTLHYNCNSNPGKCDENSVKTSITSSEENVGSEFQGDSSQSTTVFQSKLEFGLKRRHVSDLAYNYTSVTVKRLLWEEDDSHLFAIKPRVGQKIFFYTQCNIIWLDFKATKSLFRS